MHIPARLGRNDVAALVVLFALIFALPAGSAPPASAVASAHPLATEAGIEILEQGGNAFDAAVAVGAALAVVEPYSSGVGGGGFWLLHEAASGRNIMIDGREIAPGAAHPDMYVDANGRVDSRASLDGPLAAGIPGMPAALAHIAREYGRLPLSETLAPAIRLAREGFAVDEHYRTMAGFRLETLRSDREAASIFLDNGELPAPGWRLRQPDLARALELIAKTEAKGFYEGPFAKRLVDGTRAGGGIWTEEDLAGYRIEEREPLIGEYRGIRVITAPPPSSGGVALIGILNILEPYNLEDMDEVRRTHLIVEAMRRAYRDRAAYLGDPDFVDIPLERLLSPLYADGLRTTIHPLRATPSESLQPVVTEQAVGEHTTHLSILDEEGNRVAATLTINTPFGAAYVPKGTGILLNNEMDDFSAQPGEPNTYGLVGSEANAIEAGKRPLSSMTPTFLEAKDRIAVLGTPGGSRIITMVLLGSLEFAAGGDAEAIVSRERFHHQYLPDHIQYEPGGLSKALRKGLAEMGHRFEEVGRRYGDMHAVVWECRDGTVEAAADPRGIGSARVREIREAVPAAACE